jgi:hypothetical protein
MVWHLDADRRVTPLVNGQAWRVVAADRKRATTAGAQYLFCAPDFLFPIDGVSRALRLEIDPRPSKRRRAVRRP